MRSGSTARRAGLGKGLDALLPAPSGGEEPRSGGLIEVPVDAIDANRHQPRTNFDDEALVELGASLREFGILQPLLVRATSGDRFELIAGERRLRAARAVGFDAVPVVVVETDDRGALERAIVENIHREDLNPIEEAAAYRQLIDDGGLTQDGLARKLGRSRAAIANALRLLELPIEIQRYLVDGRITSGHGRALLGLQGSPFQKRLAQRIAQEGLSVREAEDLVRRYSSMVSVPSGSRPATPKPPLVAEAQRALSDKLQTRVRVEMGPRKGRVVVDFVSLEELERLMKVVLGEDRGGVPAAIRLD